MSSADARQSVVPLSAFDEIPQKDNRSALTPLELVGLSELFYRRVFGVGMFVSVSVLAVALILAGLQDEPRAVAIVGIALALLSQCVVCVFAQQTYNAVRRMPLLIIVPALVLGITAGLAGPDNQEFFYVLVTVISTWGVAVPLGAAALASIVFAAGIAYPGLGTPTTVVLVAMASVIPVFFWIIVQFLARFMLHLGFSLSDLAQPGNPETVDIGEFRVAPGVERPQRQLVTTVESSTDWRLAKPRWRRLLAGPGSPLTARQEQSVFLLCAGFEDEEIAAILGISVALVRRHLASARERTESTTRGQLAAWVIARGLA